MFLNIMMFHTAEGLFTARDWNAFSPLEIGFTLLPLVVFWGRGYVLTSWTWRLGYALTSRSLHWGTWHMAT